MMRFPVTDLLDELIFSTTRSATGIFSMLCIRRGFPAQMAIRFLTNRRPMAAPAPRS